ncbi:hypothetical protein ACS47_04880 [Bacillus cereus]|uniref:hypothetical protein n=1 Tax=Bacillus cereus group TaxID=86661 RepID=UPI0001A0479D|nr:MULTISPECIES: hypothetical protein [Bacillus cereus group]EEK97294.1 hypothetical protein bcere0013_55640 [Bacillus cereus BDRD-ST26]KXI92708.1 hypothetical protein ACS47_04880 [Bacillus cereus]KXI93327.1 hypothetical protein ACS46_06555 [Bacillus cereus]MBE7112501.1 hypothetical protein [Bacillus paranthracis]MCC2477978.1 hypothetical protein [Bacillus paranthracis]
MSNPTTNAEKLQSAIGDNLFPQVDHVSDIKQVIEVMKEKAQELQEPQIRALILLQKLGENTYLHGNEHPYKDVINFIKDDSKIAVADPQYFIQTIEALIPKPPKPIVMAEKGMRR